MKVNRILFDKLRYFWEIDKISYGVLNSEEAVDKILSKRDQAKNIVEGMQDLFKDGYDIVFHEDLQSSSGPPKILSPKDKLQIQMDSLLELGEQLLKEEKYLELKEAHEIWAKLKKEYDDYV